MASKGFKHHGIVKYDSKSRKRSIKERMDELRESIDDANKKIKRLQKLIASHEDKSIFGTDCSGNLEALKKDLVYQEDRKALVSSQYENIRNRVHKK